MKYMRLLMSIVFISFLFINFVPIKSYACSCMAPGPVPEEVERSAAVFAGTVVEIKDKNALSLIKSSADLMEVKIEVEEVWKGQNKTPITVYTERNSASCGFEFALNQEYLVYANEEDGEFMVSLCSRTAPLSMATEDLQELGQGEIPVDQEEAANPDGDQPNSDNRLMFILIGGGSGLAVGMLIAFVMSRFKKG